MIISIGFRVNSKTAIKFRTWANKIIKEYMIKGFTLNDDRFINGSKFDTRYFNELLERIKVIRTSERMAYQKITDIFIASSVDYDKKSEETYTFFKIVQNKLHYAITGHTAAELIYERVDSEKIHMGLTNWKNSPDGLIYKYDVGIAKNYLNENELKKLNNLTTLFWDYAEDMAEEQEIMTMQKWIETADKLLEFRTILDLGIERKNITEYKIGSPIDINDFDIMYMMGGNTFYLLDVIRKNKFDFEIKKFILNDKLYIGSSAGSEILGNSVETALGYDENNIKMTDFTGLKIVDGLIIPHCNRNDKLYLLYDGDGIVI